ETATLTCMATSFLPSSILLTWTQQNRPVSTQNYLNFGPVKDGEFFSIYSKLVIPVSDWQRGDVFGCVVGHDGIIPLNFIQKNIDKSAGKASHVNVSVVLSDSDVTCY
uniref:Ig-like domain-containing protein n=1 Tax=Phasianus colchicus TaxID=9054 RepID=A0A669PV73_PHACC